MAVEVASVYLVIGKDLGRRKQATLVVILRVR
jgi:hypothetical protein